MTLALVMLHLVQLKNFPFDEIKIDRSFVKDMIIDSNDAAIVRSAIALAKSLNMKTVAEGIEDECIIRYAYQNGLRSSTGILPK